MSLINDWLKNWAYWIIVLFGASIAVYIIHFVLQKYFLAFGNIFEVAPGSLRKNDDAAAVWGQFGDYFGGVLNPLIGYLSFVMLCLTIILQGKQLGQSSEELKLSRHAIEEGRVIQAATERALNKQIELATAEKDFNAAISMISIFDRRVMELQREMGFVSDDNGPKSKADIAVDINILEKQRAVLVDLIEGGFDGVMMRLSGFDSRPEFAVPVYQGFSIDVSYRYKENRVRLSIVRDDGGDNIVYRIDGPKIKEIDVRRHTAVLMAHKKLRAIMEHYQAYGVWLTTQELDAL